MATECLQNDASVDLSGWRSKYDCQVDCGPGGAVFQECHRRPCEPTCYNMRDGADAGCPELGAGGCYPGCFCPDGLVRAGDGTCVKPSACRDCVCDGLASSQYFSFDRNNFTFSGNCSYVAARDHLDDLLDTNGHDFQVETAISLFKRQLIYFSQI